MDLRLRCDRPTLRALVGAAVLLGSLAALLLQPNAAHAAPRTVPAKRVVQVFAAASLSEAFTEIGRLLERRQPGLDVRLNFAGSQQLVAQLEQGAVADVFASADERWMARARARGLVAGEPVVLAGNRLVLITPSTNPARIGRLQDLARGGIKLVLAADAVPVGRYSRQVLADLARDAAFGADFASRVLRNVVSEEENVKSVLGKVQLGEADAGIVYRSDVTTSAARYVRVFEIPESADILAPYPIAVLAGSPQPEVARAFLDLVLSEEGQAILERRGMVPAAAVR